MVVCIWFSVFGVILIWFGDVLSLLWDEVAVYEVVACVAFVWGWLWY